MKRLFPALAVALMLVTACSRDQGGHGETAKVPAPDDAPAQMAYSYVYRFSLPEAAIGAAQDRHVALCDRLGRARCRVLEMHRSTGDYGGGSLKLSVASGIVRGFAAGLAPAIADLGGTLVSNDVEAEDVGRQMVDVTARMRAKEALVARLQEALRTRPGSTADLVATEKAVADAQGELEAARAAVAQVQGRIDASPLSIAYDRRPSFAGQVGGALAAVGATLSASVVALIYFLAAAVPWALVGGALFFLVRAIRRRKRRP